MDPIALTVVFKGVGMLVALGGGIFIAGYGYRLYRDGAGSGRDQAGFELGSIKLKAHSVGSVVMSTAFLWAWAGVTLSPNLDKEGDAVRVYSMSTPAGDVEAVAVTTKSPGPNATKADPEELKKLLAAAVANSKKTNPWSLARLDGKPASIDLSSVTTVPNDGGKHLLSTRITSEDKSATLTYEPKLEGGQLVFVPSYRPEI